MVLEMSDRSVGRRIMETMFQVHATLYVLVNAFLVFIWAVTPHSQFWPVWTLGPWGFALGVHAWVTWGLTFARR